MSRKYIHALLKFGVIQNVAFSPKTPSSSKSSSYILCLCINRFPFMGQPVPGAQSSEGQNHMQQAITQVVRLDTEFTTQMFSDDNFLKLDHDLIFPFICFSEICRMEVWHLRFLDPILPILVLVLSVSTDRRIYCMSTFNLTVLLLFFFFS